MRIYMLTSIVAVALAAGSCGVDRQKQPAPVNPVPGNPVPGHQAEDPRLSAAIAALSRIPSSPAAAAEAAIRASPDRFFELLAAAESESRNAAGFLLLVDKQHSLVANYEPADLVALDAYSLDVTKPGMKLRRAIMGAVMELHQAALADGVRLTFASSYRSYAYQDGLFKRYAAAHGEAEAARFSARPGTSQHQLGTAFDLAPIDDEFATTRAGAWMAANAWRYGFSLSYPAGLEAVTGYVWESWHYRYTGRAGTSLEREFFGGVQQYLLEFLDTYWRGIETSRR